MAKDEKPKTESGTPAGTDKPTGGIDLAALMDKYASMGGNVPKGPVFTTQDANAYVQSVYQQILGRNAVGAERTKAINIFLNQSKDTDVTGRQAAIVSAVEKTPEFRNRQENRYLDAIYKAIEQDVRSTEV